MSPASLPAAAPPLEDDDLLSEILLRLPPDPSSLPRARAVSRRWRSLAADPRFCARFRAHHRRNPPLLGCFAVEHFHSISHQPILREARFCPVLEAPNRVPEGRITFPIACDYLMILGCRHGLVLTFHRWREQPIVWDPLTGDQHRLDTPPGFDRKYPISGAVLRAAAGDDFQVVLIGRCVTQQARAIASVYSSKTGAWGKLVSTPLLVDDRYGDSVLSPGFFMPAVMVGNSLYWFFVGGRNPAVIVEFDLDSWSLALIPTPVEKIYSAWRPTHIWVIPAQGGGLGFLVLSEFSAQFWKRKKDCDGAASWVLGRTIALDKLLPINLGKEIEHLWIIGLAEDNNTVLLKSSVGVFTLHLESLESKKIFESNYQSPCSFPFEGVYTAENKRAAGAAWRGCW
ncbi:uncharacterized protein [Lolium perenne]|uniref:uncharacterized protein isoform X2 n=1 Tax=Lolium perenne TaxID=4522 RepID=UPI0021F5A387|nr:uncharacterized protein LOC127303058 isoform X2 [Lolium perenne]